MDRNQLSGTLSSQRGSVDIQEGRIAGDTVSFAIVRVGFGDKIRIDYNGKISGDVMILKIKIGARDPVELTGRRGA